jgi:hypothetical protein
MPIRTEVPTNIISSASRQEVAERRAEREAEIQRLGSQIATAKGRNKTELTSQLLVFLGYIRNTPKARRRWESQ